jgi:hypothetical protein
MEFITQNDLFLKQYDVETLKYSLKLWSILSKKEKCKFQRLNLYTILLTQKVTSEFCVKYILNEKYGNTEEEYSINDKIVLQLQPHISSEELRAVWDIYGDTEDDLNCHS